MVVVDASVLGDAISDDDERGERARRRLGGEALLAPDLIFMEVVSMLRKAVIIKRLTPARADDAVGDLVALPIETVDHRGLVPRAWELRHNVSGYDAAYVALAEMRGVVLLTSDVRLSRAIGPMCEIELVV